MSKLETINDLITFKLEDDVFGIDIMAIQGILEMPALRPIPNSPIYIEGMMDLRGEIIPIINFKKLFNFNHFDLGLEKNIILIEINKERFGVIIDQILRKVTIEDKNVRQMGTMSKEIEKYVIGLVEEDDGLVSILNIEAIFNATDTQQFINSSEDEYLVKQMTKYHTQFTVESQKKCYNTLRKLDFPLNQATYREVLNYIVKILVRKNMKVDTFLERLVENISQTTDYSNFKPDGTKVVFDLDEDFYIFKSILIDTVMVEKERAGDKNLKIWNLGDSSGSEAISLAILLYTYLENPSEWNIRISCSGDSFEALQQANSGKFDTRLLRRINKADLNRYFIMEDDYDQEQDTENKDESVSNGNSATPQTEEPAHMDAGSISDDKETHYFRLRPEIKDWIVFDIRSLKNHEAPLEEVDLVLARHYLSKVEPQYLPEVVKGIVESLRKGGIILLSEVESLEDLFFDLSIQEVNNRKFYSYY